uniref:Uncharacterized protein n=1 Tax=Sander lucioperca TaxID=283035 RepID=A0A8D0AHX0_SANLU
MCTKFRDSTLNILQGLIFFKFCRGHGVLLRGGSLIPAARRAFRKLLDRNNNFLFPVVFVTNAGSCQRHHKAQQLSHLLDVQISPEQVVLSHSPLRMLKSFHDKCVLVSGQGPLTDIANSLGFQKVVNVEQLREHHPLLDMVEHGTRPKPPSSPLQTFPQIEAIILFGEPIRWETNLQLLIDVLCPCSPATSTSHGWQRRRLHGNNTPQEGNLKLTGRELQYEALLGKPSLLTYRYAERQLRLQNHGQRKTQTMPSGNQTFSLLPRDNLMTDIYGANLYDRYLSQQHAAMTTTTKLVAQGTGSQVTMTVPEEEELVSAAAQCRSILVCTGVYNPSDGNTAVSESVFHGHRDLVLDLELVEPHHVVEDVEEAVDLLLQRENLTSDL